MNAFTQFSHLAGYTSYAEFIARFRALLTRTDRERDIIEEGSDLLRGLVAHDDWLPDAYARPGSTRYRQYLLHRDPKDRFSVVSFVWGPNQSTPIHDHRTWGLVGVLRGAEISQRYSRNPQGRLVQAGPAEWLEKGEVEAVSPDVGDIHRVANALADAVSISIHVYGGDIGTIERTTYDLDGHPRRFISGYSNGQHGLPELPVPFA